LGRKPLLSQNGKIWRDGANLGDPPHAKFLKNHLRGYTPLGQINTKKYQVFVLATGQPIKFPTYYTKKFGQKTPARP